ncbi:TetR/AcrR family transcriptional regulator [Pseudobdellovibrio exovorus]|uniref:HTH tetR-type domain-containing protein n=1 Tax=Pseudobdellovibrio exovorus JSS TaxID=1184267 RepID=M4VB79_9BACT|nr:TetR family transcriptional regulator [Pseudobdellovibrio exovorus]AGH95281.1 hypothetical protein A11Q_1065 [Pseudobdellovibrio exovorus JSS]
MSSAPDVKQDSKHCILKAATALFAKLGLDKCSTRAIAEKSKANISLISYYFGGKEGLYKEVMRSYALEVRKSAAKISEESQQREMTKEGFIEDIQKIVDHIIANRLENPEISQIFSREKLSGLPYAREVYEEIFYPLIRSFYELIYEGQQKGFVRSDVNPSLLFVAISETIWGFYELMDCGTKMRDDCEVFIKDPEQLRNQIMNLFLTGVLK